jgi:murein DD-endopeptidase MepM/ murein hydrolase activator NlpD
MAAFAVARDGAPEPVPSQVILRELANPVASRVALRGLPTAATHYWREERIEFGDTTGSVLARLGIQDADVAEFMRMNPVARRVLQLRVGKPLRAELDDEGHLVELRFVDGNGELLSVSRDGDQLKVSTTPAPTELQWKLASGEIRTSLVEAADKAGIPDSVTLQLVDIFAGDIDIYHDLQPGDRFAIVYEAHHRDGEELGPGRIVAAEFDNGGRLYRAFLHRHANGAEAYYADDGAARKSAFLRSPVEFSRITSGFSNARFHPVLHTWRAHKGVDYAAPIGTPVRAVGDGVILTASAQGGYGNVIEVQHRGTFSTLYAHLSDFAPAIEPGKPVSQGDIIGYVGQSGWATGPHLHYEFRVDDQQRDPQSVALPPVEPLAPAARRAFIVRIKPALAELELARVLPRNFASAQ